MPQTGPAPTGLIAFCNRFMELLIELESQLPTRRFFNTLFHDHLVILYIQQSGLFKRGQAALEKAKNTVSAENLSHLSDSGILFVQLLEVLQLYSSFGIDDRTGLSLSKQENVRIHYDRMQKLQRFCFIHFRDEAADFALSNVGNVDTPDVLQRVLGELGLEALMKMAVELGIRTTTLDEDAAPVDKALLIDSLIYHLQRQSSKSMDSMAKEPLFPTEQTIFDESRVPSTPYFTNEYPLAIPKLNLQYLTHNDHLYRNYQLFKRESSFRIREDVIDAALRLAPRGNRDSQGSSDHTLFGGWARMALPLDGVSFPFLN